MHKNFLSFNELRKNLITEFKNQKSAEIIDEQTKSTYLKYLLVSQGEIFYVKKDFNVVDFYASLKNWLVNENKIEIEEHNFDNIKIFALKNTDRIKKFLGLAKSFFLAVGKFDTVISIFFLPNEWIEKPTIDKENEKTGFWRNFFVDNIEKYILNYIASTFSNEEMNFASPQNCCVSGLDVRKQLFVLSELQPAEILLGWQKAGHLKKMAENKNFYDKLSWFYFVTSHDSMLAGFDTNGNVVEAVDLQNRELKISGTIRPVVEVLEYQWNISVGAVSKYKDLASVSMLTPEQRIEAVAVFNFKNSGNNFKYFDFVEFLVEQSENITKKLSLFLINYLKDKDKTAEEYSKNEKLKTLLEEIIKHPQAEESLVYWYKDWQPPVEHALLITKMFDEIASDNEQLQKKVLPLHRLVYEDAKDKEKDKINKILLDIDFANHLIKAGESKEAVKILKKDLDKLPDMSLAELLPAENVDITGKSSGQLIKVMILELLATASKEKKSSDYLRQAAILQPLNSERLQILLNEKGVLAEKAKILTEICCDENLKPVRDIEEVRFLRLEKKIKDQLTHPLLKTRKVSSKISKFIASQTIPDYESIKDYAEPFNPSKYPQLRDIQADLMAFFTIPAMDIYIAHGNKSVGIRSYEGNPPFLIIGADHLDIDSPYFLTYNELLFAMAVEMAFIEFKFAKLTANDIWRGAMNTGITIADTILSLVPVVGVLNNVLKFEALAKIAEKYKLLEKTKKAGKLANSSQEILLMASETLGVMKKKFDKKDSSEKIENFLAVSRMMQITADRTALVINNDIVSAVRSVFLTSKDLFPHLETVKKYGLNKFLLMKDDKGKLLRQNLGVRFASLFSFYLSEDYEKIRKSIIE